MVSNGRLDNNKREISVVTLGRLINNRSKDVKFRRLMRYFIITVHFCKNIDYVQRFYRATSIFDFEQK